MKKRMGSIFMVLGTSIGAGMLTLPLVTAACGLGITLILLILSWSTMCLTGIRLLNACARHKVGVNFTTLMSDHRSTTIKIIFRVTYFFLLYSLLSAYCTQGSDLISSIQMNLTFSHSVENSIFIAIFGSLALNIKYGEYTNRVFLSGKLIFFILSVLSMAIFMKARYLLSLPTSINAILFAWPILLPSFGFQNIVPILYEYQNRDIKSIRRCIFLGSLTVLIIYTIWVLVSLSVLPQYGTSSYQAIYSHGNSLSEFISEIRTLSHSKALGVFLKIFIRLSVVTSLICSGMSLFHYIKDFLKEKSLPENPLVCFILTFLPPYLFTVIYPNGFIFALQFASIFSVIVFIYTPVILDSKKFFKKNNLYPIIIGSLVIICQILNFSGFHQIFVK